MIESQSPPHPPPPAPLRYSVVIPTYHRPERLRSALAGLAELEYPQEAFEVLVVNDGPNAETGRVVDSLAGELLTSRARREPRRDVAHLALAVVSQVAYVYGYLAERRR